LEEAEKQFGLPPWIYQMIISRSGDCIDDPYYYFDRFHATMGFKKLTNVTHMPSVNKVHFVVDELKRSVTAFNYWGPVKVWPITNFDVVTISKNDKFSEKQPISAASSLVTDPQPICGI